MQCIYQILVSIKLRYVWALGIIPIGWVLVLGFTIELMDLVLQMQLAIT